MITRILCAICESTQFKHIYILDDFPMLIHNTSSDILSDETYSLELIGCRECGCVQMKNIVNPSILYNTNYKTASYSKLAINHNIAFSSFILENTDETTLLEIGSNSGSLYKMMADKKKLVYTCLDLFYNINLPKEIIFIEGNCEDFNYSNYNTIILSQVFEHLVEPRKFLKQIHNDNVQSVFISIPNFNSQMESGDLNTINSQHTFFCGYEHILYLFSLYGFRCEVFNTFINNSCMFKFSKDIHIVNYRKPLAEYVIKRFEDIYKERLIEINNINIDSPTYIYPAGQLGQILYTYLGERKKFIIGFLDGDYSKHNSRMYGTPLNIYSPSKLEEYVGNNVNIILCRSPYEKEILNVLSKYSNYIREIIRM